MKKNNIRFYLVLGVAFAVFNLIAFVIPTEKTATLWTAYVFSVIAFAVQILLWNTSFQKNNSLKSKFLGIPVILVGIAYLLIQLIVFAIFMIFPTLPVWSAVVACSVALSISAICAITGQATANTISRVEEEIAIKRAFIQSLQIEIEMLTETENDPETKVALRKLAESVRFSDPMSHESLGELESRILTKVEEIKNTADKKALIAEITTLLTERNKKCKLLK